jgi:polyhydroxyalkanoate synthesis regulator phasin
MAVLEAEDFELSTTSGFQTRLDTEAVKALLDQLVMQGKITEDQVKACYKDIPMNVIRTSRRDTAKKPKFVPPNLTQATPVGVVDMLGSVREQKKILEQEEGVYKEWLQANYLKPLEAAAKAAGETEGGAGSIDEDGIPDWAKKAVT